MVAKKKPFRGGGIYGLNRKSSSGHVQAIAQLMYNDVRLPVSGIGIL